MARILIVDDSSFQQRLLALDAAPVTIAVFPSSRIKPSYTQDLMRTREKPMRERGMQRLKSAFHGKNIDRRRLILPAAPAGFGRRAHGSGAGAMTVAPEELDAIRELFNIGVGRAAGALNKIIGRTVQLNVPSVMLLEPADTEWVVGGDASRKLASVHLSFEGGLRGSADLVFASESASKLVALLTGEDAESTDLDALRRETLTEVGNILLNSFLGAIAKIVGEQVEFDLPLYLEENVEQIERSLRSIPDSAVLVAQAQFFVGGTRYGLNGERIDSELTLLMGVDSLERLLERVQQAGEEIAN